MLIEGALDENAQHGIGRMTARDLGFLFVRSLPLCCELYLLIWY